MCSKVGMLNYSQMPYLNRGGATFGVGVDIMQACIVGHLLKKNIWPILEPICPLSLTHMLWAISKWMKNYSLDWNLDCNPFWFLILNQIKFLKTKCMARTGTIVPFQLVLLTWHLTNINGNLSRTFKRGLSYQLMH